MRGILPTLWPLPGSWFLWFSTEVAASRAALMSVPNWRADCETTFSSNFYPHWTHWVPHQPPRQSHISLSLLTLFPLLILP